MFCVKKKYNENNLQFKQNKPIKKTSIDMRVQKSFSSCKTLLFYTVY